MWRDRKVVEVKLSSGSQRPYYSTFLIEHQCTCLIGIILMWWPHTRSAVRSTTIVSSFSASLLLYISDRASTYLSHRYHTHVVTAYTIGSEVDDHRLIILKQRNPIFYIFSWTICLLESSKGKFRYYLKCGLCKPTLNDAVSFTLLLFKRWIIYGILFPLDLVQNPICCVSTLMHTMLSLGMDDFSRSFKRNSKQLKATMSSI